MLLMRTAKKLCKVMSTILRIFNKLEFRFYIDFFLFNEVILCFSVELVESDNRPMGVTLVNTLQTNKISDCMDLVELAKQVQKVSI